MCVFVFAVKVLVFVILFLSQILFLFQLIKVELDIVCTWKQGYSYVHFH